MVPGARRAPYNLPPGTPRPPAGGPPRLDEEVVEAIRDLESAGEADLEAFRDKLITDWAV